MGGLLLCSYARGAAADAPVVHGGTRVDGVAAVVGGAGSASGLSVILRSDVELAAQLALSGSQPTSVVGNLAPGLLRAALDQLIGEVLIAQEAERVRVRSPSDAEVQAELDRLADQAGGAERLPNLLRRVGATRRELAVMARRRALVSSFLAANLQGTTMVTDAELERAYASGDHPFGDQPLEEVKDDLRAWLARLFLERAIRRWVEVLRTRVPVKIVVDYEVAGGAVASPPS